MREGFEMIRAYGGQIIKTPGSESPNALVSTWPLRCSSIKNTAKCELLKHQAHTFLPLIRQPVSSACTFRRARASL